MKGIPGDWKFSAKAGCLDPVFHSRLLYVFATGMGALALFSLKVCHNFIHVFAHSDITSFSFSFHF